jgi:hypothetical protein
MGTSWNGQISHKEKDFRIQFQTDDYEKYKQVEKLCQKLMNGIITDDEVDFVPYGWPDNALMNKEFLLQHIPDSCKSCPNHPSNGGSGICNCTLGQLPVTCTSGYINTNPTEDLPLVTVTTTNATTDEYTFETGV